jgi:hypothetical protein
MMRGGAGRLAHQQWLRGSKPAAQSKYKIRAVPCSVHLSLNVRIDTYMACEPFRRKLLAGNRNFLARDSKASRSDLS